MADTETGRRERSAAGFPFDAYGVVLSPDLEWVATRDYRGTMRLYRMSSGSLVYSLLADASGDYVAWTPDGYCVASEGARGRYVYLVRGTELLPDESLDEVIRADILAARISGSGTPDCSGTPD